MRRLLVLTDRAQAARPLTDVVTAAIDCGARWVLLREKDLPRTQRAELANRLRDLLAPVGGRLSVAGIDPLDGDGVHLASTDPPADPALGLVGRSCHGSAELARLDGEDYATLSPVFASASKPGYGPALHPSGLRDLVVHTGRPVLALGGVRDPARVDACLAAGAYGVAVMGAVMRAADPARVVAGLLATVPETP